jgi:vancomycin permeability regulator SanA
MTLEVLLVQVLTCHILLYVIASALAYDKSQDVPHLVFGIIVGKRASLRCSQAIVRKTVRSSP